MRAHPLPLLLDRQGPEVEHHDDKDKEHHDGSGVNDHLERCRKVCPKNEEDQCHGEQRNDEIEQGMDRIEPGDHQERGDKRNCRRYVKGCVHGSSVLTSTGGSSSSPSPFS